jgi:hypothetical protein
LEALYWASQIGILIVLLVAARFAYQQVMVFEKFELWKSLQGQDVRKARSTVFTVLAKKEVSAWSSEELFDASTACASYDVVGRLLKQKSPRSQVRVFLVESWAPSVIGSYRILAPFIQDRRTAHGTDYLAGLEWLYKESLRAKSVVDAGHPITRTPDST